jgi:tetratricopeptide (TPR) repeat protein
MHSQNLPVSWNALGLLYMKQTNYMEAQRMFLGAADVSPMDPKPYYNVGVVYDRTGWSEKALEYFLKSLDRDPRYLDSLRGAASSVLLLQRADQGALDRIHTALLLETDPAWRSFFEREQLRLKNSLDDERKMRAEFGVPPTPRRGSPVQDPQP